MKPDTLIPSVSDNITPFRETGPIVFLDKDGTLIENLPYNVDPTHIRFAPCAGQAAAALHHAGFRLAVVTNQSGVARGYFKEAALRGVEARIRELLDEFGVPLAGFYYCPHLPGGSVAEYSVECECRKPKPGLILQAATQLHARPEDCWVVGDSCSDEEAGQRAGCRTVLVGQMHRQYEIRSVVASSFRAADLSTAARIVLNSSGTGRK